MVERTELIEDAGTPFWFAAYAIRERLKQIPEKGLLSRIRRSRLESDQYENESQAIRAEERMKTFLRLLDRFVWSDTVDNTFTRCIEIANKSGEVQLAKSLKEMTLRNSVDVYMENFSPVGGKERPVLATLVDKALLVSEGISSQQSVILFTGSPSENPLRSASLAYMFLGLGDQLTTDLPEISEGGKFDGKNFIGRSYTGLLGNTPIGLDFEFRAPINIKGNTIPMTIDLRIER